MLRHKILFGEMEAVDRSREVREVLPRFKPAQVVEFRRDGDLKPVIDVIKNNKFVQLGAAVGSGKSTKIPLMLAKALGTLVVHTIPFHISARYLAEYLMTTDDGDRVVYVDDLDQDMPSSGVAIMTNAYFHARKARDEFGNMRTALLYLDEVHESDAATVVLRETAQAIRKFSCVVKATATADPGVTKKVHLPGARSERVYPRTAVSTWSANDTGVPWAASEISGNVLLCVDRREARMRLAAEYRDHGFDVRICADDVDYAYFKETIRRLTDVHSGIVVVIVDYKYRSSLTIPQLSTIIDSCEVAVPCVDDGAPSYQYRAAYDFEVQQLFGRGARLPGESVTLWRSMEASPKFMCDLELLECDAANLLYRIMGFRPPLSLVQYPYFEGDVPIDIAAALRSDHPLRLCPSESRVPWINGDKAMREEKQKAVFAYDGGVRGRAKVMSCHTLYDEDRAITPPPPVPAKHRMMKFDRDDLDHYSRSRDSSPGTVYTLKSDMPDNLSVFDADSDFPAFVKPKRVAKHIREQREAEAAARVKSEKASLCDSDAFALQANMISPPDLPADVLSREIVQPSVNLERMKSTIAVRRMGGVVKASEDIKRAVNDRELSFSSFAVPDEELGAYVYYHGMGDAPRQSDFFLSGVDSILRFAQDTKARASVRALPDEEKLYAMHLLVDEFNHNTAIAMGIQRLFIEVSGRPPDDWKSVVDYEAMTDVLEWMAGRSTEARLRVIQCRDVMPFFMKYDLDRVPPVLDLEQRVMIQMIERFDSMAIKKDPDKAQQYMRALGEKHIRVGMPRDRNRRTISN